MTSHDIENDCLGNTSQISKLMLCIRLDQQVRAFAILTCPFRNVIAPQPA